MFRDEQILLLEIKMGVGKKILDLVTFLDTLYVKTTSYLIHILFP